MIQLKFLKKLNKIQFLVNSYARDGLLYLKPTLTADRFGEDFLFNGVLDLKPDGCTAGCTA